MFRGNNCFASFALLHVCSGVAGFYYLRVIKLVYFQKEKEVWLLIWGGILNVIVF